MLFKKKLDASSFRRKAIRPSEVAAEEWAITSKPVIFILGSVLHVRQMIYYCRGIDNLGIVKWAGYACNGFATQHPDDFVHIGGLSTR